ncbi:hypothetical protein ACFL6U_12170 [Planctomycetota bacterium]
MYENLQTSKDAYKAFTVVSPMGLGENKKDQDRARFFEPGQIACVCDGVSSSPDSAKAAELTTTFAPALFSENPHNRMEMLCDLLIAHRQECQATGKINLPQGTPEAMRPMLQKVVESKKAISYQTTLIAAQFITDDHTVFTRTIKCGDSSFFAFSPRGELLTSSLELTSQSDSSKTSGNVYQTLSHDINRIHFGPGYEIFVRLDGPLSEFKGLASDAGIQPEHMSNWIVGSPVDSHLGNQKDTQKFSEVPSFALRLDDRLIIPKYLYGNYLTHGEHQYRILQYSSTIRLASRTGHRPLQASLGTAGSATLVLPDHFYTGAFECYRDTFPLQTQFLLCSDGFYSAFANWSELHEWLKTNATVLGQEDTRQTAMEKLHQRLQATKGDDDISFIWATPKDPETEDERQVNHVNRRC